MNLFMIWLSLFCYTECFIIALYHVYRGDFYGVVIALCLGALNALNGYNYCCEQDKSEH